MESHGLQMVGEFNGEKVPTLPTWTADDEGRNIYVESVNKRYYGNNSKWVEAGSLTWSIITSNTLATSTSGYLINASDNDVTLTLPNSPSVGDAVGVSDFYKKASTNTITVNRNASNIEGEASDYVFDADGLVLIFVFSDATRGWVLTGEAGVSVNTALKKVGIL
jgi:hypothetical protein